MKYLGLIMLLLCSACSQSDSGTNQPADQQVRDYLGEYWQSFSRIYFETLVLEDTFPLLDTKEDVEKNLPLAVERFSTVKHFINSLNEESAQNRQLLLKVTLDKIDFCLKTYTEERYPEISLGAWDSKVFEHKVINGNYRTCRGAEMSLVFFDQSAEKHAIAKLYRRYPKTYYLDKQAWYHTNDEIYEAAIGATKTRVEQEFLPYFRKIGKGYVMKCEANAVESQYKHHKNDHYCAEIYADWDLTLNGSVALSK